jgi:hypothetical protein
MVFPAALSRAQLFDVSFANASPKIDRTIRLIHLVQKLALEKAIDWPPLPLRALARRNSATSGARRLGVEFEIGDLGFVSRNVRSREADAALINAIAPMVLWLSCKVHSAGVSAHDEEEYQNNGETEPAYQEKLYVGTHVHAPGGLMITGPGPPQSGVTTLALKLPSQCLQNWTEIG